MAAKSTHESKPRKRILVAVDAAGSSDHAVHAGFELGRLLNAKVELLHVVGSPALNWEYVEDARDAATDSGLLTTAAKAMTDHVHKLLAEHEVAGVRVEELVRVLPGHPAQVILREAKKDGADVIVLGMHAPQHRLDFGSTARSVLAGAPASVWIQKQPFAPIRRILVPVDLSADSMNALATACALAKTLHAGVRVVHCFQSTDFMVGVWPGYPDFGAGYPIDEIRRDAEAAFDDAMKKFDWQGVAHETDFLDGEPASKIVELSSTADLVVLGTHGRTGFSAVMLGNVAYSVMKRIEKPVLAIRHPTRRLAH
jgi:nucleotide-binding universal stress UspA family protein